MNTVAAIIQARTGSLRLPGKVLLPIEGKPVLTHIIDRLKQCRTLNMIVVATSRLSTDHRVVELAINQGVRTYSGSESDVLDRYYRCVEALDIRTVIRITGDCPLIDPEIVDKTVAFYLTHDYDYVSTSKNYPDGWDSECFSNRVLKKAWEQARTTSDREHVTKWMVENCRCSDVPSEIEYPKIHLSLDTEEDYKRICAIYKDCKGTGIDEVMSLIQ